MASDSTILEKVNALRRKGNEFISRKKYKEAVQSYSQSLHLISNHYPLISRSKNSSPSTTSSTTSLPSFEDPHGFTPHMVFSNRSHAYLALGNGIASLNDAEHAIRWNPLWSKGYLRKAEALKYLCRYDESISLYYRALEHSLKETLDDSKALIESRIHATSILLDEQNLGMRVVQLLPGRDIAISSWSPVTSAIFEFAKMMQNFVYVIGCEATKKCVLVDVCWDVDGILQKVRQLGFSTILGTIVTHGHFDHIGGKPPPPYDQYGVKVDGVARLLQKCPLAKAYIHSLDISSVLEANDALRLNRVIPTSDGDSLQVGNLTLSFLHTPGHTLGSQCVLVGGSRLFSGDTLFIGNCGRLDLPGADEQRMFQSLQKLKSLDPRTVVYPGHNYGGVCTTIGHECSNGVLRISNFASFQSLHSHNS